jgi:hypothetical protein
LRMCCVPIWLGAGCCRRQPNFWSSSLTTHLGMLDCAAGTSKLEALPGDARHSGVDCGTGRCGMRRGASRASRFNQVSFSNSATLDSRIVLFSILPSTIPSTLPLASRLRPRSDALRKFLLLCESNASAGEHTIVPHVPRLCCARGEQWTDHQFAGSTFVHYHRLLQSR